MNSEIKEIYPLVAESCKDQLAILEEIGLKATIYGNTDGIFLRVYTDEEEALFKTVVATLKGKDLEYNMYIREEDESVISLSSTIAQIPEVKRFYSIAAHLLRDNSNGFVDEREDAIFYTVLRRELLATFKVTIIDFVRRK